VFRSLLIDLFRIVRASRALSVFWKLGLFSAVSANLHQSYHVTLAYVRLLLFVLSLFSSQCLVSLSLFLSLYVCVHVC
jgi:hypothetical protein